MRNFTEKSSFQMINELINESTSHCLVWILVIQRIFDSKNWKEFQTFGFKKTGHTANVIIDLLRTIFENRIIIQNSDVNWLFRSCDLSLLEYFLWEVINHPETTGAFKHEIEVAIEETQAETIENVLKKWVDGMILYSILKWQSWIFPIKPEVS